MYTCFECGATDKEDNLQVDKVGGQFKCPNCNSTMTFQDDRVKKLPVWARERIQGLERDLWNARENLKEAGFCQRDKVEGKESYVIDLLGDSVMPVKRSNKVYFQLDAGYNQQLRVSVKEADGHGRPTKLVIRSAEGRLHVEPESSNCVNIIPTQN